MKDIPQQPPIEKLLADKQRIHQSCKEHEQKIEHTFSYIQDNAGTLLLSGISSLLFPTKTTNNKTEKSVASTSNPSIGTSTYSPLGFADFFSLGKTLLPVAWNVIQPIIISWSIRMVKKKLLKLFKSQKINPIRKKKD